MRTSSVCLACCALLLSSRDARADVSSWLALGGGGTAQLAQGGSTPDMAPAFTWAVGVGTTPRSPFVVGIMYRGATYFGLGTDVGLPSARLSTGGFARGDWGLALDAGTLYRTWGNGDYGRWPVQAILTAGSPWGFELAVGGQEWDLAGGPAAQGFFAAIELDLLRLTVTRQGSSEHWWPNPNPAGGHQQVGFLF